MPRSGTHFLAPLVALSLLAASFTPRTAHAQDRSSPPEGTVAPPPAAAVAPNGEYVAPLQQQTQVVYVPQSVALSGPPTLTHWDEGDPIPQGYHVATRTRKGLIVGGAVTFGTLYLISLLVAAAGNDSANASGTQNGEASLYIPGIGPFIQMGKTSTSVGNVFLAVDGIAQTAGLAMLIYGIASPRTLLVRNDLATRPLVTPMMIGQSGYGMGVLGHF